MGLFNFWKKEKEQKDSKDIVEKLNPHSIDIFVDDKLNIAFIPTLHTKIGYGQSISYFKLLDSPYSFSDIGNVFIQVLNDMRLEPILNGGEEIEPAYKIITGGKGFLAFQRKRQLIKVSFSDKMKFEYWYRKKRGFGLDKGDKEILIELPLDSSASEIGKAVDDIYFEVNRYHLTDEIS